MEEILKNLAEHFGFVAPFGYAALAYGFFHWLDENASDEAKAALPASNNDAGPLV